MRPLMVAVDSLFAYTHAEGVVSFDRVNRIWHEQIRENIVSGADSVYKEQEIEAAYIDQVLNGRGTYGIQLVDSLGTLFEQHASDIVTVGLYTAHAQYELVAHVMGNGIRARLKARDVETVNLIDFSHIPAHVSLAEQRRALQDAWNDFFRSYSPSECYMSPSLEEIAHEAKVYPWVISL